ncbi:OmpA family protein [Shewanella olleyana]|uniref:OmpA family protein n=1 Tax=Shewanella olleyana TaxID=135626 RepID=UPI00200C9BFE|nr:OmpA family protein [Shewanella olleyana]MCL1066517.1 OmpA family protein [Shewanella olleyana]
MNIKILVSLIFLCFIPASYAWIDSDKDGVPDKKDACPDTPVGVVVLANGCQDVSELTSVNSLEQQDLFQDNQEQDLYLSQASSLPIYFDFARTEVLTTQLPTIKKALPVLLKSKAILLVGHTDNVGSEQSNLSLSLQRALSVKKVLVEQFDFEVSAITVLGKGSFEPVTSNTTAEQRQLNRRVEFKVKK